MGGGGGGGVLGTIATGGLSQIPGVLNGMLGNGGADAAQAAQMEKFQMAQQQQQWGQQQLARGQQGMDQAGQFSLEAMRSMQSSIDQSDKNLSRQEQLVSQIDPTIVAASQQALALLKGQSAPTLGPLQSQRDYQRQQLVNSLRSQMGPGAETSSAGMQALTNFDRDTSNIMSQAQQSYLGTVTGVGQGWSGAAPNLNATIGQGAAFRNVQGQYGINMGLNQANFSLGGIQAMRGLNENLLNSAGADQTSQIIQGQQQRALGQQLIGGAFSLGGMALMGGRGGGGSGQVQGQSAGNGQFFSNIA